MQLYPAVDIKGGKAVRLRQGEAEAVTVFYNDPVEAAKHWQQCGAKWLHVVDLDGAFTSDGVNLSLIQAIAEETLLNLQVGGGIRSLSQIEQRLKLGVKRVVIGTAALENSSMIAEAVKEFGHEAIACGIDAKNGKVAIKGWVEIAEITPLELAIRMRDQGVNTVIYTDISRDGMMIGPNFTATKQLIEQSGMNVIASGGIAAIEDLRRCKEIGCAGAITGQAIYTGAIDLEKAICEFDAE
ncbi:MAG: 1-(5-phosphoribosyl)-5-[(5-phosphoribosylamino)methylideneamino]imidazole-4-carboxamide isomerase [Clostridiales bacterium]|nr:1-(5-phosphoribosyl)-5-[(5-phosphoribosylamino)methylideneamino]imidazole-4-carboxamide isomerase [Clostridiales bacterium]